MIYELDITLANVKPIVYRKIWLRSDATFADLHKVIQLSFDWWDYHQHYFSGKEVQRKQQWIILPEELFQRDNFVSKSWLRKREHEEIVCDYLRNPGDEITYTYDFGNNWVHTIRLNCIRKEKAHVTYPCCVDARHCAPPEDSKLEILRGQREIQTANIHDLKQKINYLLTTYVTPCTQARQLHEQQKRSWENFYAVSNTYLELKAWERITNEQIIAYYIEERDEYIFCSVLGSNEEMYGFTVYEGFHGFLALFASLLKDISIETIMQYQTSILLHFAPYSEKEKQSFPYVELMPTALKNHRIWPYVTSYQAGFYPWRVNQEELSLLTLALTQTIKILNNTSSFAKLPSFKSDNKMLCLTLDRNHDLSQQRYVTVQEMLRKINPVKNAISELELKKVSKLTNSLPISVEFAMKYVNIPIQRLKGQRPFFPVTSVMTNHDNGTILYHNIFDDPLQYENVQRELLQMLCNLNGIPERIYVDEFIYFYLQPLFEVLQLPIEIVSELPRIDEVIGNISQILSSN